jgi:hypothetical protein
MATQQLGWEERCCSNMSGAEHSLQAASSAGADISWHAMQQPAFSNTSCGPDLLALLLLGCCRWWCCCLQELLRVELRQKQLREQQYAHINGIKIHNQWRKIMRLAKVRC